MFVPLLGAFLIIAGAAYVLLKKPRFSRDEKEALRRFWVRSPLLEKLQDASKELLASDIVEESMLQHHFFSPDQLSGVVKQDGTLIKLRRQLIAAYSLLEPGDLAQCFAVAFLADPAGTLVAGTQLAIDAKREAARLASIDTILCENIDTLARLQQLNIAGCVRALTGHDDIIEGLFSSAEGRQALARIIEGECQIITSLPEIQRFMQSRWVGKPLLSELAGMTKLDLKDVSRMLPAKQLAEMASMLPAKLPTQSASSPPTSDVPRHHVVVTDVSNTDADADATQAKPPLAARADRLRQTASAKDLNLMRRVNAADAEEQRQEMLEAHSYSFVVLVPIWLGLMPILALFPPLGRMCAGKATSRSSFLRQALIVPPCARFWMHEISCIAFTIAINVLDSPITRKPAWHIRDWALLICAVSLFLKQIQFVLLLGVGPYLYDRFNVFEIFASICTVGALVLGVCNANDWPVQGTPPALGTARDFAFAFPFATGECMGTQVPLAAQEALAVATGLRWVTFFPRVMSQSSTFGPLKEIVVKMAPDMIKYILLLIWPLLAFAGFFRTLFDDVYNGGAIFDEASDCPDYDTLYEDWGYAFNNLFETALAGTNLACYHETSSPYFATAGIYIFVLVTVVMFLNMLIAMMAKTFDNLFEVQEMVFLYLKARNVHVWTDLPVAPAPFNLLSFPYGFYALLRSAVCSVYGLHTQRKLAREQPSPEAVMLAQAGVRRWLARRERDRLAGVRRRGEVILLDNYRRLGSGNKGSDKGSQKWRPRGFGKAPSYVLPRAWAETMSVDELTRIMSDFISDHSADIVREERFKRELFNSLSSRFDQQLTELRELRGQQSNELSELRGHFTARLDEMATHVQELAQAAGLAQVARQAQASAATTTTKEDTARAAEADSYL